MNKTTWIKNYLADQKKALDSIPVEKVESLIKKLAAAAKSGRRIFVFGNGGSASNSSHFSTDLGKGASDKLKKRFNVLSLTDNTSWITALGNDYSYEDIFVGQLQNYAEKDDIAIGVSVSGNSPNAVKALEWAKKNKLITVAMVGGKKGRMAETADEVIVIDSLHYGRVEDAEMTILHMLCYAFMEHPEWVDV